MSEPVVLNRDKLMEQLSAQVYFLQASAASYDSGFKDEAKRMAVALRILFFTKNRSASLIEQLDGTNKLYYLRTSIPYQENNLLTHAGLLQMQLSASQGTMYAPLSGAYQKKWCTFPTWWNEIIVKDNKSVTYTRGELICTVADKDGGAHVDPAISEAFANLKSGIGIGWMQFRDGKHIPLDVNVAYESIRQITYETLRTLANKYPELEITRF